MILVTESVQSAVTVTECRCDVVFAPENPLWGEGLMKGDQVGYGEYLQARQDYDIILHTLYVSINSILHHEV